MIGSIIGKIKAKSAFNALNNRDIDGFISAWSEDALFYYPGNLTVSGKYVGKQDIEKWFNNFLNNFPRFTFSIKHICVDKLFDVIGSNVISVEWEFSGENINTKSIGNRGMTVIELKKTKAISVRDYIFDQELLRQAWGE